MKSSGLCYLEISDIGLQHIEKILEIMWIWRESQNSWDWKGPLEIIKSNHSAKAGSSGAGYTGLHIQVECKCLQSRRFHSLPRQPVPVLCHPQRKEVFPHIQMKHPVFQFVPVVPCLVTWHHWKGFWPIILTPAQKIFVFISENFSESSLLEAEQASPFPYKRDNPVTLSSSSSSAAFLKD